MADYNGMSKGFRKRNLFATLILMAPILFVGSSFASDEVAVKSDAAKSYKVVPRIPVLQSDEYDNVYPCTDCHTSPSDYHPQKRELSEEHDRIAGYHPMNSNSDDGYWCNNCHQAGNYNTLKLNSGQNISFNESYKICLQCHGNYKDEFENGVHGRKTGHWDTKEITIYSCPTCHDPHSPAFKPMKPDPAPHPRHGVSKTTTEKK